MSLPGHQAGDRHWLVADYRPADSHSSTPTKHPRIGDLLQAAKPITAGQKTTAIQVRAG
jgi:hypothetical protein